MDPRPAFFEACELALGVVRSDAVAGAWDRPSALDGFTVGALASHLYSAIRLFESALAKPEAPDLRLATYTDFYSLNRVAEPSDLEDPFQVAIRDDATRRSAAGAAVLAEKFSDLIARLRQVLEPMPLDRPVPVWRIEGGATSLTDYLLTRIVELLVHADDLAVSVGVDIDLPPHASSAAFDVFVELARARFGDRAVLRAFTRKERGDPEVLRVL